MTVKLQAADRLFPNYVAIAGPGILPAEWLKPLRSAMPQAA